MGIGNIGIEQLDEFIIECDRLGGPSDPNAASYLSDFSLNFKTYIDQNLDPFSNEYFQSQISLYEEIAGVSLNQEKGEQFSIDVDRHALGVNPYTSNDTSLISRHARAILTALHLAKLQPNPNILDMGSGWGLSSELFAFCGANVTCVDINPLFIELNQKRAKRLDLPIKAHVSEFDAFTEPSTYDLIFFYECLHHSIKPWETLLSISRSLKPGGKIAFSGEPINDTFWRNWGLRLDPLSIYCIRKFGWFESGWSEKFLSQAFEYAGLKLHLYPHIGLDNGFVGIATRISEDFKPEQSLNLSLTNLSQHYFSSQQSYDSLSQEYNSLSQKYNSLLSSRLYKLILLIRKRIHSLRVLLKQ